MSHSHHSLVNKWCNSGGDSIWLLVVKVSQCWTWLCANDNSYFQAFLSLSADCSIEDEDMFFVEKLFMPFYKSENMF